MLDPCRGKNLIRFLAVVIILFSAVFSLHGKGAREANALDKADEYINQKEYDEAIIVLSEYLKDNPDRFGEAQKRLQKIVKLREEYNRIANELLDTIETDSDNNEKILALSNLLLTIESPTNPTVRRFLDQVRYLAEFNVNRKRLDQILLAGRTLLEANNYQGALANYASGLDIYQRDFFNAGYGHEAEEAANSGLETIGESIRGFNSLATPFNREVLAMTNYYSGNQLNPERSMVLLNAVKPYIDELGGIYKGFLDTRKSYDAQLEIIQRESDVGDRIFLSFAGRLITGPAGQNEGMAGAVNRYIHYMLNPAETALMSNVDVSYNTGFAAMTNRDYSRGILALDESSRNINSSHEFIKSWNSFLDAAESRIFPLYDEMVREEKAGDYLKLKAMSQSIIFLTKVGDIGAKGNNLENSSPNVLESWLEGSINTQAAISQEQNIRNSYQGLIDELVVLENNIVSEMDTLRTYQERLSGISGETGTPQSYITNTRNLVTNLNYRFQAQQLDSIVGLYTIANGDLEKRVIEREKEFGDGNYLIRGFQRNIEGQEPHFAYFPGEGLDLLTTMNGNLGTDINSARSLVSQYEDEPGNILAIPEVNSLFVFAQNMLSRLLGLQAQSEGIMASARIQVDRAASLRFEGDRLFQAAQAALSRNDLATARSSLTRSTDQYNASLAIQDSDTLRAAWDAQGVRLGAEIDRIENEIVVRDVRNLVNSARDYYFAGNMEQAESALVTAQNRWRVTNIIAHPEVEDWLNRVRGALSIQSSRTIPITAPLYAEMSQLLSDATRNYNEGVRLLNAGSRQDGITRFNEARSKTREVKLIFPLNQDASMLELRIEQQTNPPVFNANFQQRLNDAIAGTKTRNLQSFADLQDLAEINPGYPRIQAILTQAEIDMGYRPPPPNPEDLARSAELTRNAQAVINSRNSISYDAAKGWLSQAIRLNPNNNQASILLDQINVLSGSDTEIYLPTYAMEQYNRALQEFLRGNYVIANSIVEQLLPQYPNSWHLHDLRQRIDAVL